MGDPDGTVSDIHVLSAGSGRTIRVDAQFLVLDVDLDVLIDLRRDEHRRERSLATSAGVEWRNSNKAMHTAFGRKQTVGVIALDSKRRRLDTCLASRLLVEDLHLESLSLRPAQIHAEKHLTKVLRVCSAGTRLQRTYRVVRIGFARK